MIVSSKFPQFRHRVVSIPLRDPISISSQIVSITINPPHRSHGISFPPDVCRSYPCVKQWLLDSTRASFFMDIHPHSVHRVPPAPSSGSSGETRRQAQVFPLLIVERHYT